jgi:DNA (cytosine-5)-methyltransferase 1
VALPAELYISLFSGAGGLDLSIRIAIPNAHCCLYVEREFGAARILAARMEDGSLDEAPIWSDVRTLDCGLFRGRVAGIIGGFPCTNLSVAGKREGIHGEHSSLWFEYLRIIRDVRPRWVFVENVPAVIAFPTGGIVLGGLAEAGFDAEWISLRASDVGAPHKRERIFVLAHRNDIGGQRDATGGREAQHGAEYARAELADRARGGRRELRQPSGPARDGQPGRQREEGRIGRRGVCEAGEPVEDTRCARGGRTTEPPAVNRTGTPDHECRTSRAALADPGNGLLPQQGGGSQWDSTNKRGSNG